MLKMMYLFLNHTHSLAQATYTNYPESTFPTNGWSWLPLLSSNDCTVLLTAAYHRNLGARNSLTAVLRYRPDTQSMRFGSRSPGLPRTPLTSAYLGLFPPQVREQQFRQQSPLLLFAVRSVTKIFPQLLLNNRAI